MARRIAESGYSFLKMLGKYYVRFKETYARDDLAWVMAGAALGARDAHYKQYRGARFSATAYARGAGLGGPVIGQVQAAIMYLEKHVVPLAKSREDLCRAVETYVDALNLKNLGYGEGKTAADAVLNYFGCAAAAAAPPAPTAPAAPSAPAAPA